MIKISFIAPQRKVIRFEIEDKKVKYFDEVWKLGLQILPKHDSTILKMKRSGKKNIQFMVALILDVNSGKEFEQYQACKNDEEVRDLIIKDCESRGLILVK